MQRRVGVLALLFAACVRPAAAQTAAVAPAQLVPGNGTYAISASVGGAVPGEDAFKSGWSLNVSGERYFTPRLSLRAQVGGTWWDISGVDEPASASPVAAIGNLAYNWQRGRFRPYATGGLGIYKFRFTEADLDSSETQMGLNFGGGTEYALRGRHAILGEVLIHSVAGSADSLFHDYTPWYWTLSVGYKHYF